MKKKAIIISIKGYKLSKKEKSLLANERPWGLILFKRNIKSLSHQKFSDTNFFIKYFIGP